MQRPVLFLDFVNILTADFCAGVACNQFKSLFIPADGSDEIVRMFPRIVSSAVVETPQRVIDQLLDNVRGGFAVLFQNEPGGKIEFVPVLQLAVLPHIIETDKPIVQSEVRFHVVQMFLFYFL